MNILKKIICFMVFLSVNSLFAQILINVSVADGQKSISPWIYGRNNNIDDTSSIQLYKDAGLKMLRENNGNNSSKYNFRGKLSSHPNHWYNNIYTNDWDERAETFLENFSDDTQMLFGLQLLGKVADNTDNNFNDWDYNGSSSWEGTHDDVVDTIMDLTLSLQF